MSIQVCKSQSHKFLSYPEDWESDWHLELYVVHLQMAKHTPCLLCCSPPRRVDNEGK